MFRESTEWPEGMCGIASSLANRIDGADYERGDLEEMRAEIRTLRNTLAGLMARMVLRGELTEHEAEDLIETWGWSK